MIGNKFNPTKLGFSLVEVVVSVSLFSIIVLTSTQIFKMVVDSQRSALATQNVQESLKYFLEVTGKEMRMAQKNNGVCPVIDPNAIFRVVRDPDTDTDILSFKNYYGQCVTYSLSADPDTSGTKRFRITRGLNSDFISPAKISLDSLHFVLTEGTSTQPMITLNLSAHALNQEKFKSDMTIQTSITSRYYK